VKFEVGETVGMIHFRMFPHVPDERTFAPHPVKIVAIKPDKWWDYAVAVNGTPLNCMEDDLQKIVTIYSIMREKCNSK
jgi:hypothetical protein